MRMRLSHLTGAGGLPTVDLYFRWSCASLFKSRMVQQISPTVFLCGQTAIVFRHAGLFQKLPRHSRLIYVVDDDWRAALSDKTIPQDYKIKLRLFEARGAARFERTADAIVVSSDRLRDTLAQRNPAKPIHVIEPFWRPATQPTGISKRPPAIAMLGTRSHAGDHGFVFEAIQRVLSKHETVEFLVSRETPLPRTLATSSRLCRVPSMTWHEYLAWKKNRVVEIGLYPLRDTAFNRARSNNKLIEYDQFGAAVVGSKCWEAATEAADTGRCLLAENHAQDWTEVMLQWLEFPEARAAVARANRKAIRSDGVKEKQVETWKTLLEQR